MKQLIDLLHLLSCHSRHEQDMMKLLKRKEGVCYYYLESDIDTGDQLPDHKHWKDITEQFKTALGLSSDQEALDFIRDSIEVSKQLRKVVDGNKLRREFIMSLDF